MELPVRRFLSRSSSFYSVILIGLSGIMRGIYLLVIVERNTGFDTFVEIWVGPEKKWNKILSPVTLPSTTDSFETLMGAYKALSFVCNKANVARRGATIRKS